MRRLIGALAVVGVAWSVSVSARQFCAARAVPRTLQPGDVAPDFELAGTDGRTYRLADYRGKQAVVLAWFARASSPG
jgi:peroxiredoxin Q/BCP